jgi:hypothetical protein
MLLVPPVVLLVAGLGFAICQAAGWVLHGRELLAAALIALLGGCAAFLPLALVSRDPVSVSQAALGGTVIHMMLAAALGVLAVAAGFVTSQIAFAWWMLAFYWATLVAVAVGLVSAIRVSSATTTRTSTANGPSH